MSKLPESARLTYARQLADEAKTLVPGMERLSAIAEELRADDLYRLLGFDTWERFCSDYLGVSKRTANRWIAGPKPKSIAAGQSVAAGQNVPVVESKALNFAKTSEGGRDADAASGRLGGTLPAPTPSGKSSAGVGSDGLAASTSGSPASATGHPSPADPSSGGAGIQPAPNGPTGDPTSPLSASPDPPERPPSDRQLAARVFAAMREVDPTDAGPVTTPEEATFLRQWAQRTLDAWKAVYAPPAPAEKPQRRQGTITRPADRRPKVVDLMEALEDSLAAAKKPAGKRHADDCSCLSCKAPKAVAK